MISCPPLAHVATRWLVGLTLIAGCAGDDGDTSSGPADTGTATTMPTTSGGSGTTEAPGTDTAGSGTAGGSESSADTTAGDTPPYSPCEDDMACTDGGQCGGFGGAGRVCMPTCGDDGLCPEPETGTSTPFCGVNALSSQDECTMDGSSEECMAEGEVCRATGGGGFACLLPPTHCILLCGGMFGDCPDGMECSGAGVCQWGG